MKKIRRKNWDKGEYFIPFRHLEYCDVIKDFKIHGRTYFHTITTRKGYLPREHTFFLCDTYRYAKEDFGEGAWEDYDPKKHACVVKNKKIEEK